ncbi:peritrophin-1-like [Phlebotomus argentipes]|uniref:peritrophin-1-like n=1 Tax=Phlebotomus argentipes TaxID=94469 RepID=UPI0028937064|nr:peritrophin-1-like [Phlebotomus argentipes]
MKATLIAFLCILLLFVSLSVAAPKGDCPETDPDVAVKLHDDTDCEKYYVCKAGEAVLNECPPGLGFSFVLDTCTYAGLSGCMD